MTGFMTLVRRINLRHLYGRRLRTLLTTVGVAAGVALVFSIAVINSTLISSFRSSIKDLAGSAEIEVASADQTGIPEGFVDRILDLNGVEMAVPVTRSTTTVKGPSGSERIVVLGITPEFTSLFPRGLGSLAEIRISGGFSTRRDVILARAVADEIGARPGDAIVADTPSGDARLTTSGVVSGGALAAFNGGDLGIMLLPGAQHAFDRPGLVDSIYVVLEDRVSVADMEAGIDEVLGRSAVVGPPGERGEGIERVFGGLASLLSLAGTVSLFVALFVVFNTMSMSLAERRREMAMAMALGAARRQVFGAFIGEAALFGIVASVLGIGGGLLLARVLVETRDRGLRTISRPSTGTARGSAGARGDRRPVWDRSVSPRCLPAGAPDTRRRARRSAAARSIVRMGTLDNDGIAPHPSNRRDRSAGDRGRRVLRDRVEPRCRVDRPARARGRTDRGDLPASLHRAVRGAHRTSDHDAWVRYRRPVVRRRAGQESRTDNIHGGSSGANPWSGDRCR